MAVRFAELHTPGPANACWPWAGCVDRDGYGVLTNDTRVQVRAHRVAYELAYGPIPSDKQVMHECDNPPCCNPKHLRAGTSDENNKDKAKKLRASAKLTPDAVRQIRAMASAGHSVVSIAKHVGVSYGSIYPVLDGRTWRHVE